MVDELDGVTTFIAVAESGGFRAAGARLGVSHSAVSGIVRRLEDRVGTALFRRSTRRVHLTDAGERLLASVRPALDQVRSALTAVGEQAEHARSRLRVHTSSAGLTMLATEVLPTFLTLHPHVQLDLVVGESAPDLAAGDFDAGLHLAEAITAQMETVPVTGPLRMAVVGAPSYFARRGIPRHPRDLAEHECLNWHRAADAPAYRWEFTENGHDFSIAVPARVLSTSSAVNRSLAIAGLGLTMAYDVAVREPIAQGQLVSVLEDYCTPFPGYCLFFPERQKSSRALAALVEHVQQHQARTSRRQRR
jgi:DNA-binding transcriptional LysR family regulator